ncbi:MAG: hypothetical protein ACKV0T_11795 [Planctomycetales bacterium]
MVGSTACRHRIHGRNELSICDQSSFGQSESPELGCNRELLM